MLFEIEAAARDAAAAARAAAGVRVLGDVASERGDILLEEFDLLGVGLGRVLRHAS